jgi:hypothetical protein
MKTQESSPTQGTGGNPAPSSNHLFAYSVEEYDAGNGKKGRSWTRIGAAFPHKEGPGFNIELRTIPLDGRIVLLPPDESSDAGDNGASNNNRDDRSGNGNGNGQRRSR